MRSCEAVMNIKPTVPSSSGGGLGSGDSLAFQIADREQRAG
jgi:hypothetical protein